MTDLLHVAKDVLSAVKHSTALLAVQLVDEISGEVLVAILVPETQTALKSIIWVNFLCESLNYGQINPENAFVSVWSGIKVLIFVWAF